MSYFLAKTDPETYSIDDLKKDHTTTWDGVKNPTARIVIKSMMIDDIIFLYHSQGEGRIVGLMKVISKPIDDVNDPKRSSTVDVEFIKEFEEKDKITLKEIKLTKLFEDWELVRISRLSTMKVPNNFITWLKEIKNIHL